MRASGRLNESNLSDFDPGRASKDWSNDNIIEQ